MSLVPSADRGEQPPRAMAARLRRRGARVGSLLVTMLTLSLVPGAAAAAGAIPAADAASVQRALVTTGLLGSDAVTGVYDRDTARAVATAQGRAGLAVDGVPGPQTLRALRRETA